MRFSSPLRYPGGKASLAPFLGKVIEKNNLKNVIYVEPYAGGAGAALELLFSGKVSKIIINDYDKAIYTFWNVAVNKTEKLINKIKKTEINVEEWKRQRVIYNNKSASDLDRAFSVFFLNRTNISGIIGGGPIGGVDQRGTWKINARFNKKALIDRLRRIKKYKKKIRVYNKDGIKLLESLKKGQKKNVFIFLDPPYFAKGQFLYLNHYGEKEHSKLSKTLRSRLLKWIMTYDDNSHIRKLYKNRNIKRIEFNHTARSFKKGRELVIYPSHVKVPYRVKSQI